MNNLRAFFKTLATRIRRILTGESVSIAHAAPSMFNVPIDRAED